MSRALNGLLVAGTALVLALAGCGDGEDGDTAVKAAEVRVAAKERALTDAEADLADKSEKFCSASRTYITGA